MVLSCCVVGCKTTEMKGMTLHKFPFPLRKVWSLLSGQEASYGTNPQARICNLHFKVSQYYDYPRSKCLKRDSIPTQNLPVDILIIEPENSLQGSFSNPLSTRFLDVPGDEASMSTCTRDSQQSLIQYSDKGISTNEVDIEQHQFIFSSFHAIDSNSITTPVAVSEVGKFSQQLVVESPTIHNVSDISCSSSVKPSLLTASNSSSSDIRPGESCNNLRKRKLKTLPFLQEKILHLKDLRLLKNDLTSRGAKLGEINRAFRAGCIRKCAEPLGLHSNLKNIDKQITSILQNKLSPLAFHIAAGELENSEKSGQGRRWDRKQKALAAAFYKLAPRAYQAIARMLCLPRKSTILTHLKNVF